MDTQTPLLEAKNLSIAYSTRSGPLNAVINFNMTLHKGDSIGIVGESGCGKTTVLLALMNYLGKNGIITSGDIFFKGKSLLSMSQQELTDIRGNQISMIYQEPMSALNPCLTIGKQLLEVLAFHSNLSPSEAQERTIETLHDVRLPEPEHIMTCYPHQISGGQQQRIVIAMALLSRPTVLLLDEPTTALDVTVEYGIIKLINSLKQKYGSSMIYISHNMGLIRQTCEDLIVMYSGHAVETGKTKDVFSKPSHPYTQGLLKCIPSPAHEPSERPLSPIKGQLPPANDRPKGCFFGPRCHFFKEGLCDNPNGITLEKTPFHPNHFSRCARTHELEKLEQPPTPKAATRASSSTQDTHPLLSIQNIKKNYHVQQSLFSSLSSSKTKTIKANNDISLSVYKGQIVSIVGESGCGKTTLAKLILGLEKPSSGSISFDNQNISDLSVRTRDTSLISHLQMIFQNPNETLNPSLSVGYQITRAVRKFNPQLSKKDARKKAFKLFDMVSLSPQIFFNRLPMHLSGGQKQRIGISRAFAGSPSLVIADEPVSALDVSVQSSVIELLHKLQLNENCSLLVISHDLSLVRYLSDFVVVMYLGHIMESGPVRDIFSPPFNPYTEALLAAVPIADVSISKRDDIVLEGNLPSPFNPPKGCPLSSRCHRFIEGLCDTTPPPTQKISDVHSITCHIPIDTLKSQPPIFTTNPNKNNQKETKS
jgi:peptide/nickel transport system ATP-binding protein